MQKSELDSERAAVVMTFEEATQHLQDQLTRATEERKILIEQKIEYEETLYTDRLAVLDAKLTKHKADNLFNSSRKKRRRRSLPGAFRVSRRRPSVQRLDDLLAHLLGVAEQHHGVVGEEQRVIDARITRRHAAFDEQHRARLFHVQDRHPGDRAGRVGLGGRVGHVVGPDHIGDVGGRELVVDFLKLEDLVIGHVGFGQ